ncbi:unnamed protein product [Nyctereutes procyonoides]|uniref:(raccoon dog) hypothetical protein n=1 Tax=Nyctereutes procyonoides TaxID=34880 RepID=A0A811ZUD6_NYCPR|nr:unnamed protein product [Nyctereutes procyonoides]
MEIPEWAQHYFSKGLLLSASILALWIPQGSWAALHIQKIPEHPQKDQDLLLSVQGIPGNFQDFNWYLGEETNGGMMLFTYFPDLQQPQRNGSAMGQHDIIGFPNGSMLLHRVAVNINPAWIMRAKTEVQVAEKHKELPIIHLPVSAGIMTAIIIGSLAAGSLFIGCIAHLLLTGGRRGHSHRMTPTEKPEARPNCNAGDQHIYEVMLSPTHLVSPLGGTASTNNTMPLPGPENHPYQDLLNPDPAPYCQLTPTP